MSEYKIRSQRRRRQNYAPYRTRKEQGIVSRMWNWLTPSSWWQGTSNDPSPSPSPSPPPPSPPPSHDNPPSLSNNNNPPPLSHDSSTSSKQLQSQHLLVTTPCQPLVETDMEQGQVNGMEPEEDSSSSWVAEDTTTSSHHTEHREHTDHSSHVQSSHHTEHREHTEHSSQHTEHSVERMENPAFTAAIPRHVPSSSSFGSGMRPGPGFTTRVIRSRPLLTSTPQLSPVNEADEQGLTHYHRVNVAPHNDSIRSSRHGNRTESQSSRLPSIPEQSPAHSVQSVFHSTPSVATGSRTRTYTDLSLSCSPFQSPFYSGRTAFGGAASGQRLGRSKRSRRESSPPVLAPVQMTVTARPHPSAPPTSSLPLSSSTARKILLTLDSLSSPLADARRLPLRGPLNTAGDMPARKRHKSAHTALPPPVSSLSSPSLNPFSLPPPPSLDPSTLPPPPSLIPSSLPPSQIGPVFVPNEISIRQSVTTSKGQRSSLGATLRPNDETNSSIRVSLATTGVQRSSPPVSYSLHRTTHHPPPSTPTPPSASVSLSQLPTVTSAPRPLSVSPAHSSATQTGMATRSTPVLTPVSTSATPSPLATSGGKMKHTQSSRAHYSHRHDNQDRGEGPVAMVPAVGLKIQSDNIPSFGFAKTLIPLEPSTTAMEVVKATTTLPNFSFSTPKQISSQSAKLQAPPSQTPPSKTPPSLPTSNKLSSFQFSAPNPCTPTKTGQAPPFSQQAPPTTQQAPPTSQQALKTGSVVEILRQPDYTSLLKRQSVAGQEEEKEEEGLPSLPSTTGFKLPSLAPLTDKPPSSIFQSSSDSLRDTGPHTTSPPPLSSLSSLVPAGGWECDTCLVRNKEKDERCVACGTANKSLPETSSEKPAPSLSLLTQFAVPSGSWECPECMVQNKASDGKCIACTTAKPGSGASGGLQLGSGTTLGAKQPLTTAIERGGGASSLSQTGTASLAAQFAPPKGSWSCETCMVDNSRTASVCVACGTARPGAPPQMTPPRLTPPTVSGAAGGMKLGTLSQEGVKLSGGGLTFGGGGLKFGEGGLKFGGGGLKLGEGGLKIGGGGLNFGEGGLRSGGVKDRGLKIEGGLKFGEGGLKFGEGGLKLGSGGLGFGAVKSFEDSSQSQSSTTAAPTGTSGVIPFGGLSSSAASHPPSSAAAPAFSGGSQSTTVTGSTLTFGSTAASQAPSLTFGSTAASQAPSLTLGSTAASQAPSLTLGSTAASQAPTLTLGSTAASQAPTLTFGSTAVSSHNPPKFLFGSVSSSPALGLSLTGSSAATAPAPTFTFGASTTAPSLSFAAPSTTPSLSFAASSTPSLSFGMAPSSSVSSTSRTATLLPASATAVPPSFGSTAAPLSSFSSATAVPPSFGSTAAPSSSSSSSATAVPPSSFSRSTAASSTPGFSLGTASTAPAPSLSSRAPVFSFGAVSTTTAPFGAASVATGNSSSGLQFGSQQQQLMMTSSLQPSPLSSGALSGGPNTLFSFSGANPSTGQPLFFTAATTSGGSTSGTTTSGAATSGASFNFGSSPSFSFGGNSSPSSAPQFPSTSTAKPAMFTAGVATATQGGGRIIRRARRRGLR